MVPRTASRLPPIGGTTVYLGGGGGGGGAIGGYSAPYYIVRKGGAGTAVYSDDGTLVHGPGADDDTEINWAIANLMAGRDYKQTVLLKGSFSIDNPIAMDSYTVLVLDGEVELANSANCDMLDATNESEMEIRGGEWDGRRNYQAADIRGFDLNTCTDVIIYNVEIHDIDKTSVAGQGIKTVDSARVNIVLCTIYNCGISGEGAGGSGGEGVLLSETDDSYVFGCTIHDCNGGVTLYAGASDHSNNNRVEGCHFEDITRDAISLYPDSATICYVNENVITGNIIVDASRDGACASIRLGEDGACIRNIISNNHITEGTGTNLADGIAIMGSGSGFRNIIAGNTLDNLYSIPIFVNGSYNTIEHNVINTMREAANGGIVIDGGATGDENLIAGNFIYDTQNGILIQDNADNNLLDGNYINTATVDGVVISGATCDATVVINHYIIGAGVVCIRDYGTNSVQHNNYKNSGWVA